MFQTKQVNIVYESASKFFTKDLWNKKFLWLLTKGNVITQILKNFLAYIKKIRIEKLDATAKKIISWLTGTGLLIQQAIIW